MCINLLFFVFYLYAYIILKYCEYNLETLWGNTYLLIGRKLQNSIFSLDDAGNLLISDTWNIQLIALTVESYFQIPVCIYLQRLNKFENYLSICYKFILVRKKKLIYVKTKWNNLLKYSKYFFLFKIWFTWMNSMEILIQRK